MQSIIINSLALVFLVLNVYFFGYTVGIGDPRVTNLAVAVVLFFITIFNVIEQHIRG